MICFVFKQFQIFKAKTVIFFVPRRHLAMSRKKNWLPQWKGMIPLIHGAKDGCLMFYRTQETMVSRYDFGGSSTQETYML